MSFPPSPLCHAERPHCSRCTSRLTWCLASASGSDVERRLEWASSTSPCRDYVRYPCAMLRPSLSNLKRSALCTAKALLSRGTVESERLLKASSFDVRGLLEPFTGRLAHLGAARTAAGVWRGLYGRGDWYRGLGVNESGDSGISRRAFSAEVWTTVGECSAGIVS